MTNSRHTMTGQAGVITSGVAGVCGTECSLLTGDTKGAHTGISTTSMTP